MKTLKILGGIVLCVVSLQAFCQLPPLQQNSKAKPSLFGSLPEKTSISKPAIDKIFAGGAIGQVKILLGNNSFLEGKIIDKIQRSVKVMTVNIRLSNFDNALFSISRIAGNNDEVTYIGRILNIKYSDVMVLSQESGQLYLVKEKQALFLTE